MTGWTARSAATGCTSAVAKSSAATAGSPGTVRIRSIEQDQSGKAGPRMTLSSPIWVLAALAPLALAGCSSDTRVQPDVMMPSPEPPALTPTVLAVESTSFPTPQPEVEYRRTPPSLDFDVFLERAASAPYPTLLLSYRPYNACSVPELENRVEWQPGRILVETYQLVGFPEKGCPSGNLPHVYQSVPLDRLTDGDEIYVNGEFMFKAADFAICYDFTYRRCPTGCERICTSSYW